MKKTLVVFLLLLTNTIVSQETETQILSYKNQPLNYVLFKLEKIFEVRFSYNSKIVENKHVSLIVSSKSLDKILSEIEKQTQLVFTKAEQNQYIINTIKNLKNKEPLFTVQQLSEVVIKNYFVKGFTKNNDGSIKATPKNLQILPGLIESDVLQGLQLIPGIQSPDETATGLNIRGGTPDQNLILWDGIKMYQYDHFFGMLSAFNPHIIQDVKIFKSAASAQYGNHLSGVIDIQTDTIIPKKIKAGLGLNMIYADAYVKIPIRNKIAIIASARRSYSDIFKTITFDKFADHIFQNTKVTDNNQTFSDVLSKTNYKFYFTDFNIKALAKPNKKNTFSVSSVFFKNKLDFVSQFSEINQNTNDNLDILNKGINGKWQKKWSSKWSHTISASYSDYKFSYIGEELLFAIFDYKVTKKTQTKEFSIQANVNYNFNKNEQLVGGFAFEKNDLSYTIGKTSDVIFDPDFFIESTNTINNTYAWFGEYRFNNKKWQINSGIRASYFSAINKFVLQPQLMIEHRLNTSFSLKLSAENKYQPISQIIEFETQNLGLENQVWVLANKNDIPILQSKQFSLGGVYKQNKWFVDIDAYYKKIEGLTSLTKGFNREVPEFSTGTSTVFGVDAFVRKQFRNFSSLISYSITNNKFKFRDLNNNIPFYGNSDMRHYLTLVETLQLKNFEFSLSWKNTTPKPYTPALGLVGSTAQDIAIDYGEINSSRLSVYHRLDASASYKFKPFRNKTTKAKIGISLINVYNQKNIINRSYRIILNTSDATYQLREINKFSIGLTPNFVFRLDF